MKPYAWEVNRHLVTDSTGRKLTVGLFQELSEPTSPFTLADWRKVYVELADPTDYKAALVLIGNWDHWQALLGCKPFTAELEKWRAEVDAKLRSEAIEQLRKQSRTDKGTAAAKWLAEEGVNAKKRGPGRPSLQPKQEEVHDRTRGDAIRIGLTSIPGGKQ